MSRHYFLVDKKVNPWLTKFTIMNDLKIAQRIRRLRLENKLTLQEMAQRIGFTKSYLSMIERGKKSPPIATLSKVAHALGVDIGAFFEQQKPEDRLVLVKAADRKAVVRDASAFGYRYESIAPTKARKKMEPFVITLPPKIQDGILFDHEGEELFYVLEGKIQFLYGDKKYMLKKGDSVYFDSSIPHRGEGAGGMTAKALVVVFTP